MTFTHPTETRYRSPSGTEQRAAVRGQFKPTLAPLPPELPEGVGAFLASLNRRERRRFAAKARAHAATRREPEDVETITFADGTVARVDRERGTATMTRHDGTYSVDIDAGALGAIGAHNPDGSCAIHEPATKDHNA